MQAASFPTGIGLIHGVGASNLENEQLTVHRNCIVLIVLQSIVVSRHWRTVWLTLISLSRRS